jgi:TRAP-type transport system periplasmic protein
MLSRRSLMAAGSASALPLLGAGPALAKTRLRFSAYLAPVSHSVVNIVKPWMKSIEDDLGGELGFDLYAGGSLGRSPYAQFDLLRAGVADLGFAQPSYTTGQFKQLQILEVPLMTRNSVEASVVAWQLYERGLVKGFEDVHVLGFWTAEPGNLFMRKPIKDFSDLKNLKIRSSGRLEGEFVESLGATAEAMFPADVYEAMRRHTIDGTVQGLVAVYTFQTYRVTSHILNAPFGVVSFALVMNKRTWQSLPAHVQDVVTRHSGLSLSLLGGQAYDKRVAEIDKKFRAMPNLTYIEPSESDLEQLRVAVKPLVDAWIARTENGAETYAAAQDILAQLRTRERAS